MDKIFNYIDEGGEPDTNLFDILLSEMYCEMIKNVEIKGLTLFIYIILSLTDLINFEYSSINTYYFLFKYIRFTLIT